MAKSAFRWKCVFPDGTSSEGNATLEGAPTMWPTTAKIREEIRAARPGDTVQWQIPYTDGEGVCTIYMTRR